MDFTKYQLVAFRPPKIGEEYLPKAGNQEQVNLCYVNRRSDEGRWIVKEIPLAVAKPTTVVNLGFSPTEAQLAEIKAAIKPELLQFQRELIQNYIDNGPCHILRQQPARDCRACQEDMVAILEKLI